MHESSRKVAETLQEIYSPEWDGHGELRAIAEVSAGCPQGSLGGLGGLGGPGCHRCPCPCPRRAMTSCGMTTRRSWPTKPCGSWRITWLSSGTLRCPPARAGGVGDRGGHGGVLAHMSAPPPRSASPSGAESSWTTTAPGTTWRLCRAPRKRTRPKSPRLGLPGCPRTAPKWGQSPVGDKATNPPCPSPQAEEEFNKAQAVFEDLNRELREELPVLYGRYGAVPGLGTPRGLGDIRGAGGHCGGLGTSWRDITWAWGHHGSGTLRGSVTRWGLRDIVALGGSVGAWGHCGAGGHRHGCHPPMALAGVSPQSPL